MDDEYITDVKQALKDLEDSVTMIRRYQEAVLEGMRGFLDQEFMDLNSHIYRLQRMIQQTRPSVRILEVTIHSWSLHWKLTLMMLYIASVVSGMLIGRFML